MSREVIVKVPKLYRGLYDRAKEEQRKLLKNGRNMSIFSIMLEFEKGAPKEKERFPGFRL